MSDTQYMKMLTTNNDDDDDYDDDWILAIKTKTHNALGKRKKRKERDISRRIIKKKKEKGVQEKRKIKSEVQTI